MTYSGKDMKATFVAIDKMIEGVPYSDVARDECDGRELEFFSDTISAVGTVNGTIRVQIGKTIYMTRRVVVESL